MRWDFILFFASLVMIYLGDWALYVGIAGLILGISHGVVKSIKQDQARRMVILLGLFGTGVAFLGFAAFALKPNWFGLEPQSAPPKIADNSPATILRFSPVPMEQQIEWQNGLIPPTTAIPPAITPKGDPFKVKVANIGGAKAIDIELTFRLALDVHRLEQELRKSGLFPGYSLKGDLLTLPTSFGKSSSTTWFHLTSTSERMIDQLGISGDGQSAEVRYPDSLVSFLSVWILCRSAEVSAEQRKFDEETNPKLRTKEEADAYFKEGKALKVLLDRQRYSFIVLPDVTVTAQFRDLSGRKHIATYIMRAVILPIWNASWVTFNSPGQDRQGTYLLGPNGILSYEDRENPEDGNYNRLKRSGYF